MVLVRKQLLLVLKYRSLRQEKTLKSFDINIFNVIVEERQKRINWDQIASGVSYTKTKNAQDCKCTTAIEKEIVVKFLYVFPNTDIFCCMKC